MRSTGLRPCAAGSRPGACGARCHSRALMVCRVRGRAHVRARGSGWWCRGWGTRGWHTPAYPRLHFSSSTSSSTRSTTVRRGVPAGQAVCSLARRTHAALSSASVMSAGLVMLTSLESLADSDGRSLRKDALAAAHRGWLQPRSVASLPVPRLLSEGPASPGGGLGVIAVRDVEPEARSGNDEGPLPVKERSIIANPTGILSSTPASRPIHAGCLPARLRSDSTSSFTTSPNR